MKRIAVLILVVLMVLEIGLLVLLPKVSEAQTITWKMQTTWPAGMALHTSAVGLAKRIEEMTGGRLKIEVLPAGAIVPAFEVLGAVHKGTIDAAHGWSAYWIGKHPAANLFSSVAGGPFGMDNVDYAGWLYHGGGLEFYRELYLDVMKMKVMVFPTDIIAYDPFGLFNKTIKSWAELKGLKMRESGLTAEIYKEAGITVVAMPGGEILPALERGVIDGAAFMCPTTDKELGLMDVAKYYHAPGIHRHTGTLELLINKDVWDKLPADIKAIIDVASRENLFRAWIDLVDKNVKDLEILKTKHGVKMVETSKEILLEILKAWDKVAARYVEKDPFFAKVYASQKEYAKKIVQYRREFYVPYEWVADYYWPKKK